MLIVYFFFYLNINNLKLFCFFTLTIIFRFLLLSLLFLGSNFLNIINLLVLTTIGTKEYLIVNDVMRTEDPSSRHTDIMHKDMAIEPQIECLRVRSLRESKDIDRHRDSSDDGANDIEFELGPKALLAVVNNEDIDGDDRVIAANEDKHEGAEYAEGGVGERGRRAESDADGSEDAEEDKVELAQLGALVEGVVGVGDLVADEGEGDESEVEKSDVGVYGLVKAAEEVEEDGGRHGAHAGDVDAEVPEVVDGPAGRENKLEGVDLDPDHDEKGGEVCPDVYGLVVVLEGAV